MTLMELSHTRICCWFSNLSL